MRNRREARFVALLIALPLAAQTEQPKPAAVEGIVKDSVSGAAIPRVQIKLGQYATTASAEGRFTIAGIEPGDYSLTAQRPGFVARERISFTLRNGENKTDVEIKLTPTGVIAGRVTDSDGEPVESARVEIIRGAGPLGSRTTDDNGQFRVGGLPPGRYRVRVSAAESRGRRPEIRTDGTVEHHDAATWYPGALTVEASGSVVVQPGADSIGVDIRLIRVPFVRVNGRVLGVPRGARDAIISTWHGIDGSTIDLRPDGSFEIWRLDPGRYRLAGEWTMPTGEHFATAGVTIDVADSNIDNIELRYVAPSDIPGQIEYDDDAVKELVRHDLPGHLVHLSALDPESDSVETPQVAADGSFRIDKLPPRRYWLSLADDRFYIKSMRLGATLIDGAVLDLSNGSAGADLSVRVRAATGIITGTVQDDNGNAGGAPVLLVDARAETGFEARIVVPGPDGVYTLANVPPGNYKLVATGDTDPEVEDNQVLGYENQMDTVTVGDGEKVTKDLKRRVPE